MLPDQAGVVGPKAAWLRAYFVLVEAGGTLVDALPGAGPENSLPVVQPPPALGGCTTTGGRGAQKRARGGEEPAPACAGGGNTGGPAAAAGAQQRPHAKVHFQLPHSRKCFFHL